MIANIIVIDYAFTLDRRLRLILTGPVVSLCPGWENVDSIDDGEDGGRWDGDDTNDDQDRCAPAQLHPDSRGRRGRRGFWETSGSLSIAPLFDQNISAPWRFKTIPEFDKSPSFTFSSDPLLKKTNFLTFSVFVICLFPRPCQRWLGTTGWNISSKENAIVALKTDQRGFFSEIGELFLQTGQGSSLSRGAWGALETTLICPGELLNIFFKCFKESFSPAMASGTSAFSTMAPPASSLVWAPMRDRVAEVRENMDKTWNVQLSGNNLECSIIWKNKTWSLWPKVAITTAAGAADVFPGENVNVNHSSLARIALQGFYPNYHHCCNSSSMSS